MNHDELIAVYGKYMSLSIQIDNPELKNKYTGLIETHNQQTENAGFDIITPLHTLCMENQLNKINFGVKCKAVMVNGRGKPYNTGFYMYPRSSISKTPLRLANSVGIIDAGYRGDLIGAFDVLSDCAVQANDRLVQVCAPGLVPIIITIVDNLGDATMRGSGGFGSTGR